MKGYSIGLIWQDNRVAPVDQGYLDLVIYGLPKIADAVFEIQS